MLIQAPSGSWIDPRSIVMVRICEANFTTKWNLAILCNGDLYDISVWEKEADAATVRDAFVATVNEALKTAASTGGAT